MSVTEFAPAKLNLGLWILGRRDDGYHELLSLIIPITLGDELSAEPAAELSVSYEPPHTFAPDLAYRAAEQLRAAVGSTDGAKILVRKAIPVGAGLGGGSADAAAVLRLLPALWRCMVPEAELFRLAQQLGSDVPVCLIRHPALVRGRGDLVQPVPFVLPYSFVVLFPGFSISTAWAYAHLRCSARRAEPPIPWDEVLPGLEQEPALWQQYLANDFEPLLFSHYPQLRQLRDELLRKGAFYAAVTGSGSAVFGVFASEEQARAAARCWYGSQVQSFVCAMYRGEP